MCQHSCVCLRIFTSQSSQAVCICQHCMYLSTLCSMYVSTLCCVYVSTLCSMYVSTLCCVYVSTLCCVYVSPLCCVYVSTLCCVYVSTLCCVYVSTLCCVYVSTLCCVFVSTLCCVFVSTLCVCAHFTCAVAQARQAICQQRHTPDPYLHRGCQGVCVCVRVCVYVCLSACECIDFYFAPDLHLHRGCQGVCVFVYVRVCVCECECICLDVHMLLVMLHAILYRVWLLKFSLMCCASRHVACHFPHSVDTNVHFLCVVFLFMLHVIFHTMWTPTYISYVLCFSSCCMSFSTQCGHQRTFLMCCVSLHVARHFPHSVDTNVHFLCVVFLFMLHVIFHTVWTPTYISYVLCFFSCCTSFSTQCGHQRTFLMCCVSLHVARHFPHSVDTNVHFLCVVFLVMLHVIFHTVWTPTYSSHVLCFSSCCMSFSTQCGHQHTVLMCCISELRT